MYDRRARPTLRVLHQLTDGWTDVSSQRALASGDVEGLSPLAELPHPLVAKARDMFGSDPAGDAGHQPIACAASLGLFEIRAGQWRGGVWTDPTSGVRWLVVAGLAKGNHEDSDDFYVQLKDLIDRGLGDGLLPTMQDANLLRRETANVVIVQWELEMQRQVAEALTALATDGTERVTVNHPTKGTRLATITVEKAVEPDTDGLEVFVLDVEVEKPYRGTDLAWTMTMRVLTSICPPQQDWDHVGNTFSAVADVGHAAAQATKLSELTDRRELCRSEPGDVSHYAHYKNLAENTVQGRAVRAMCGTFFVPYQDFGKMPVCPECDEVRNLMPV